MIRDDETVRWGTANVSHTQETPTDLVTLPYPVAAAIDGRFARDFSVGKAG